MTYMLKKVGKGKSGGFVCHVRSSRAVGWGSRPDLAIRSWHQQHRLNQRNLRSNERFSTTTTPTPNLRPKKG